MGTDTYQGVVEAVEAIAPVIREHAAEAETGRRLSPAVMDAMRSAGLFRLMLPRSLGGLEADMATYARAVEAVSRHDSAAGWLLQAANMGDWWGARLPDESAEEIHGANPDALAAAAFHPPVSAVAVDGGFRITGRRALASSIHDADWLLLTAVAGQAAVATILPAGEAEVIDTWNSLGMRGTDSNDVVVQDVFVPARRTWPLMPQFEPGAHYGGPLYRMSAMAITSAFAGGLALGIARAAVEALRELVPTKVNMGSARPQSGRTVVHARLGRAEGLVRAARALLYATLDDSMRRAESGAPETLEERSLDLLAGVHAVQSAVEAVDLVYSVCGSSAVYAGSPIERHFRDIQTVRHHGFVCESRFEAVGQVMLGVDPEFGFVAF